MRFPDLENGPYLRGLAPDEDAVSDEARSSLPLCTRALIPVRDELAVRLLCFSERPPRSICLAAQVDPLRLSASARIGATVYTLGGEVLVTMGDAGLGDEDLEEGVQHRSC